MTLSLLFITHGSTSDNTLIYLLVLLIPLLIVGITFIPSVLNKIKAWGQKPASLAEQCESDDQDF